MGLRRSAFWLPFACLGWINAREAQEEQSRPVAEGVEWALGEYLLGISRLVRWSLSESEPNELSEKLWSMEFDGQ